jgi:hypothetical protein
MEPLNYVLNVQDPFAAVMNGFNNGQNRLALQDQAAQNKQASDILARQEQRAQTTFSQGQTDRASAMAAEQQQAAASQQRAAAMQADLTGLAERVQAGTATQQDFATLTLKYPDLADELSSSMDAYEPERKRAEVFDVSRVAAALKAGSTELAIQIAQERADAAQNAGLARDAAMWQGAADTIKASPEAGLTMAGLMLQGLDQDAFKNVFDEGGGTENVVVGGNIVDRNTGEVIYSEPPKGPEWRPATAEEAAANGSVAGQVNTVTGKFDAAPQLPRGTTTTIDQATGRVVIQEGGGAPNGGTVASIDPRAAPTMLSSIAEIKSDPVLNKVLGPVQGGGGNDVDQIGTAARVYYGGDGLALIEKIAQLQNTTWFSARELLKGGGTITDYESRKAEGAMARLSRVKDEAAFDEALKDLWGAIDAGTRKLVEAGKLPPEALNDLPPSPWEEAPPSAGSGGDKKSPITLSPEAMKFLEGN